MDLHDLHSQRVYVSDKMDGHARTSGAGNTQVRSICGNYSEVVAPTDLQRHMANSAIHVHAACFLERASVFVDVGTRMRLKMLVSPILHRMMKEACKRSTQHLLKEAMGKTWLNLACSRTNVILGCGALCWSRGWVSLDPVPDFERIGSRAFIQSVKPGEDEKIITSMKTLFFTQDWHDAIKQGVDTVSTTVYISKVSLGLLNSDILFANGFRHGARTQKCGIRK